jgi:hypothetical protein
MTELTRTLSTLLLAFALAQSVGCGDDSDDGAGDNGGDNKNSNGGDNNNGSSNDGESNGETNNGGDNDGTNTGDAELPACPKHAAIKDDGSVCVIEASETSPITGDLELAPVKGKEGYLIKNGVFVGEDVGGANKPDTSKKTSTLKIAAGTKFFGASKLSFLAINRGSKIEAVGTADRPIVFSSGAAGDLAPGDWGGVIINGRAPSNDGVDVMGEAGTGKYAGEDKADSSGKLKYVRIEFGGGKVDDETELNGLALQGVGSGTEIDYVHVHANADDGVEFFGGTVNAKHLVVTHVGDDGLDWTSGWTGKLQYAIVQQLPNYGDNGIEADNQEKNNEVEPFSNPTISNFTFIGSADSSNSDNGLQLRRGTKGSFYNGLLLGWNESCILVDGDVSGGFVGKDLTIKSSRISCAVPYAENTGKTYSKDFFEGDDSNEALDAVDVLEAGLDTAKPDFTPRADSDLLDSGESPSDSFFTAAKFIGAIGTEDWTKGNWMKITKFAVPAE